METTASFSDASLSETGGLSCRVLRLVTIQPGISSAATLFLILILSADGDECGSRHECSRISEASTRVLMQFTVIQWRHIEER